MRTKYRETLGEKVVREELERQGINFSAQFPFRNGFIVDFALHDFKVIIEVDIHPSHFTLKGRKKEYFRDMMFKKIGWKVVHLTEDDLLNISTIIKDIRSQND